MISGLYQLRVSVMGGLALLTVVSLLGVCAPSAAVAGDAKVVVGKPAPDFTLPKQDDTNVSLGDLKGKWVVLYFYPKDDPPGCTIQACDFTEGIKAFEKINATVIGCSPDSTESHRKFIEKHDLKIDLLSDTKRDMMKTYGAINGKKVQRSTVLIDPKGVVAHHWPKVSPKGHIDEVKKKLKELQK